MASNINELLIGYFWIYLLREGRKEGERERRGEGRETEMNLRRLEMEGRKGSYGGERNILMEFKVERVIKGKNYQKI